MPTISRKDLDNSSLHLTVTLLREDLKPKLDAEFKRFKQRATIKGFRPGQAPAHYVKSLYGASIFYDVFNKMLTDELYGYLRDANLEVLGQPLPVAEDDKKFTFKIDNPEPEYAVTYEIGHVPAFEIAGLNKETSYDRYEVTDLDTLAASDMEDIRKRGGGRSFPEDNIEENDILRIESKELEGDKVKEGGWATTITAFVKNIPNEDLKQQILAAKKGSVLRFTVTDLDNARDDEKFVRKYLLNLPEEDTREVGTEFEGEIIEISRVGAAELNEEFFKTNFGENVASEAEALDALKVNIANYYRQRANALLMRELQEKMLADTQIDLPETFLKRWLKISNEGNISAAQVDAEYDSFAQSLRWSLIRDKMLAMFNVEVTQEEIEEAFIDRLRGYFQAQLPMDLLRSLLPRMMKDKKEVDGVRSNIEYDKMFSAAIEQVSVNPKPVTSSELHSIFEAVTGKGGEIDAE